ncbi:MULTISPECIES: hypothetical protein [Arsenophonus]
MKKLIIGFISIVALNGCMSTPNEVRLDKPLFEVYSNKSPQELAKCIYDGWTNTRTLMERDNTTHTENFGDIITVFSWHDIIFVDITKLKEGSLAKMYKTTGGAYALEINRKEVIKLCK